MKKVGYVHIPKCAGSALNEGIFRTLEMQKVHISSVVDNGCMHNKKFSIIKKTPAFTFAKNNIFLSGHISYNDMVLLNRDYIFTVLRDPMLRFFSHYTYLLSRANSEVVLSHSPASIKYKRMSFVNFSNEVPSNGITEALLVDFFPGLISKVCKKIQPERIPNNKEVLGRISKGLNRFDAIFAMGLQEVVDFLSREGLFDRFIVDNKNASKIDFELDIGCSVSKFKEIMLEKTRFDTITYSEAKKIFPKTVTYRPLEFDEFLEAIKKRYNLNFSS